MPTERRTSPIRYSQGALIAGVIFALYAQGCAHQAAPPPPSRPPVSAAEAKPAPAEAAPLPPPPPVVEQTALDRLKAMSETLAAAKSFSFHSHSMVEIPAKTGQFLTFFAESDVALERPNRLRADVTGDVPNFQFSYDGSQISAYDPEKNLYAVTKAPDNLNAMLDFTREKAGISFPTADLMYSDPYAVMTKDLTHAIVVGPTRVNGTPCDHFAYMGDGINWEIWIETGKIPLPRRLAMTYKDKQNFPRFLVEFSNWKLNPKLKTSQFSFKKPDNAQQIEFASRVHAFTN